MSTSGLFNEFDGVSKVDWLKKALSDRKGVSLEEINWDFEGVSMSPFFHQEDLPDALGSISLSKTQNSWQNGERIYGDNVNSQNKAILRALESGVSALYIDLTYSDEGEIEKLFAKVQHEWISTHLDLRKSDDPIKSLRSFSKQIKSKGQVASDIRGNVTLSATSADYWRIVKELITVFPLFRVQINEHPSESQDSVGILVSILETTYEFLQEGQKQGLGFDVLASRLHYSLSVGDEYYKNIVQLRSLRRLVEHLCSTYEVDAACKITIETWLDKSDQTLDKNYNLIKNTSQILGAVIGGADVIYPMTTTPSIAQQHDQRISRNINHVLETESYMDRVVDPAAGSYFFETMTDNVCKKAWEEFLNRVEE